MNLPNRLTLLRVILIPIFVFAFLFDPSVTQSGKDWICFVIYVVAGLTDWLDGYIARKNDLVTDFGKLMDPLADKLLNAAALICFTAIGILNPVVTIVIISREFLVTGIRMIAAAKGKVIAADIWGKLKTISQDITIGVILFNRAATETTLLSIISEAGVLIMTVLTVISAVNYCYKNRALFSGTK